MMTGIQLEVMPSTCALADRAAEFFVAQFSARTSSSRPFIVALSGGRISQQFFQSLTSQLKTAALPLDPLHFFWADERCVPPDHPDSLFATAKSELFDPLGIPQTHVHRIEGELPPHQAASNAEADLRRTATLTQSGQPVIDLLVLGMGEDGHSASLFPNETEEALASPAIYRHVVAPKPPPNRITLGFPTIATARAVVVLVSGPNKHEPLSNALKAEHYSPFAKILRSRQTLEKTLLLTDFSL